jgi:L-lactate dehydrogenase complex protein LldG
MASDSRSASNSRSAILATLRKQELPQRELPSLTGPWITYPDRAQQFAESLRGVGGQCEFVASRAEIAGKLAAIPAFAAAKRIVSLVPEAASGNVEVAAIEDPHQLEDVDFAILPGQFGVAENAAIWITDAGLRHRVIYFIPQHLALVIPRETLVDNMHQAYERLLGQQAIGHGFGAFISGPSKTADIEQSLVIGAHGPRSLTVFCVGA